MHLAHPKAPCEDDPYTHLLATHIGNHCPLVIAAQSASPCCSGPGGEASMKCSLPLVGVSYVASQQHGHILSVLWVAHVHVAPPVLNSPPSPGGQLSNQTVLQIVPAAYDFHCPDHSAVKLKANRLGLSLGIAAPQSLKHDVSRGRYSATPRRSLGLSGLARDLVIVIAKKNASHMQGSALGVALVAAECLS